MKQMARFTLIVFFLMLPTGTPAEDTPAQNPADGPFKPNWESLRMHQDPQWFRDAKFGIYTHWGPVTVGCEDAPHGGEWYGREMYLKDNPIFSWHQNRFGDQRTFGYKDVIPLFRAPKFDPEKWADLFALAGAKFAGPVAVHHDNFAMWDSTVTPWNSMKMGPKRDITGELADAYRARGLRFVPTFHHGFAWRYFEPAFEFDAADGKDFQLYSEPHDPNDPPSPRFQEQWLAMVMEVVRKYEPDMIWFDFELKEVISPECQQRMFAEYYNWAAAHGRESAVAHKFREIHAYTGILDFERGREDKLVPYPWLTDTSLGPWFNRKADPYRSTENLIHVLADIVSKNGCLLLNVGPNADGSIPQRAEKMLLEIGAWLKLNGEAIYGTRPWQVYGEGPTHSDGGGFSEGRDPAFTSQDIRFTTKGDALYAIVLGWPEREFTIQSIQVDAAGPEARVELLGHGEVPHRIDANKQIVIGVPSQRPCEYASVFKLTDFKTSLHPDVRFEQSDAVRLEPAQATCEGTLRLQVNEGRSNIGFWDAPGDRLHWLVHVKTPGRYTMRGEFSSAYGSSGLQVTVGERSKSVEIPKTDGWFRPQFVSFGEFQFDKPGVFHLVMEAGSSDRWHAVNVYQIQLAKVEWSGPALAARATRTAQSSGRVLDHITLTIDKRVLRPMRNENEAGTLTLTAFYLDGSRRILPPAEAVITARTKSASGNVDVVAIQGDKVIPKEGGIATVEAMIVQGGRNLNASVEVVVAPFYHDYHQALVMKLFMGMEGDPVERLAKDPLFQIPHDVLCTFEEALEVIRKADNLTRGIPKIIYLVGWQKGGHDHGYPAWDQVNPRLKRPEDATALDSLRWLIREARQYHTTVSLHINMTDAYEQSPSWDEYVAKDCVARDENGRLFSPGIQMKGEPMYNVVYPKEWEAGLAQRRIDKLIAMIPELKEGHTIHIDVFIAQREGGKPISPWHAKPENGGLTPDKYVETQRRIFHYWRDRGFDVTGEGIFWAHPPGEGFTGLQAMSWWYPADTNYQMQIPECLMARGRTHRDGDGDFRFGSSMHGEEIWQKDKDNMPGFLGMFCRTTLPWYYLSRLQRVRFEDETLFYSDAVVARTEDGKKIIRRGNFVLREDDHLFVPALWNAKEIIAYSRPGYTNKAWELPDDWQEVTSVDLYKVTLEGCIPLKKKVPVAHGRLILTLGEDEAVSVVPAGVAISGI